MQTRRIVLLSLLLAGCGPGGTRLAVSVASSMPVDGIDHFVVETVNAGMLADPVTVAPAAAPFNVDPGAPVSFTLEFDASRSGAVQVDVAALDGSGKSLSDGSAHVLLVAGQSTPVTVQLGAVIGDGGT